MQKPKPPDAGASCGVLPPEAVAAAAPRCPPVLIAGIGNIFLGDDAFGVEVVRHLAERKRPEGVRIVDFGIRGLDLTYALLDGYQTVVLVDAAPRGGRPGTLYVIEPDVHLPAEAADAGQMIDAHALEPAKVLRLAASLGGPLPRILLVACEPQTRAEFDDLPLEMSAAVRAAVDEAVLLIESLVAELLWIRRRTPVGTCRYPLDGDNHQGEIVA